MKRRPIQNLPASVRQRLLDRARASDRPFNELLQYYAMERFLYRLSRSSHRQKFILKGALMLTVWKVAPGRSTKDIDLLGRTANDIDHMIGIVQAICAEEVDADGLEFDASTVQAEQIAEEGEYAGVRLRLDGTLGTAKVKLQLDVGFGDSVIPAAKVLDYPTLLDMPAPRVRGYSRESAISEKFHVMAHRGLLNSRMRDYFDIWALSRQFEFEGEVLARAIRATFDRRGLAIPARPVALRGEFASDTSKVAQWRGFLRKTRLSGAPENLADALAQVRRFLGPVIVPLARGSPFAGTWRSPGPWVSV